MHISEGVLSAPVLVAGAALAAGGVAAGLRKMDYSRMPEVAVMSSAFFVAALVHVPVGPASFHLTLNGLMGVMLGWAAFPAILVALALQALVFQFGGFTALGANTAVMAVPAVLCYYLFGPLLRSGRRKLIALGGFGAGAAGILLGTALLALCLMSTGEAFSGVVKALSLAALPAAVIEGLITASAAVFFSRVKPEMLDPFHGRRAVTRRNLGGMLALIALSASLVSPGQALAHKVGIFAYAEGERVVAEGYFADGRRCKHCAVEVLDAKTGEKLLEGETDGEGMLSFARPSPATLRIVMHAGQGHQTEYVLDESDGEVAPAVSPATGKMEEAPGGPPPTDIQAAIEEALERKLQPVMKEIARLREAQERPGVSEVLGGIGYIIGLMGLAVYFKYRKTR